MNSSRHVHSDGGSIGEPNMNRVDIDEILEELFRVAHTIYDSNVQNPEITNIISKVGNRLRNN